MPGEMGAVAARSEAIQGSVGECLRDSGQVLVERTDLPMDNRMEFVPRIDGCVFMDTLSSLSLITD